MSGLSTAVGTNYKANLWLAMGVIAPVVATFGEDWMRLAALVVFCLAMTIINWRIQGSGIDPDEGEAIKDEVLEEEPQGRTLEDVLREGRI